MFLKNTNIISKSKRSKVTYYAALKHLIDVFILLLNVKKPIIVGILTFMTRIKVMLSYFEHENKTGGIIAKGSCYLKKKTRSSCKLDIYQI